MGELILRGSLTPQNQQLTGILHSQDQELLGSLNIYTMETGDGRDIELALIEDAICWRRVGDMQWQHLVDIDDLRVPLTDADKLHLLEEVKAAIAGSIPIESIDGLLEILNRKVEIRGEVSENAILIATEDGSVECSDLHIEDLATKSDLQQVNFTIDHTLKLENGVLSVHTTDQAEQDNTLPITSAGVNIIVGNIAVLLESI